MYSRKYNHNLKKGKEYFINGLTTLKYSELSQRNHFGFPLTNTDEFNPDEFGNIAFSGSKSFEKTIYDKIILMDLYNKNKWIGYDFKLVFEG